VMPLFSWAATKQWPMSIRHRRGNFGLWHLPLGF